MVRVSGFSEDTADVIVVGGGPAGASAAARIADRGYRVVLIDRSGFPRDKVCGDFVGPAGLAELFDLGVHQLPAYRSSNVIRGAALFLDGAPLIEQPLPQIEGLPDHGRVIPRMVLDQWIWDAARARGVRTLERLKVERYTADADGVTVLLAGERPPLRARLLLAADGSASTIARQLTGEKPDRKDRIVAVRAYYEGVTGPEDRCDLYFSEDSFPGYYWLFPTGQGRANVGVGMILETLPPTEGRLADLLEDLIARDPALRERLGGAQRRGGIVGWPLMTYARSRPVVADRLLLLGDAAGLINPINGEGIQYALESGRWAAEAAVRALAADALDAAGLAPYEAELRARMDYDMALAGMIVTLIRNRALNPVWLTALRVICARARRDPLYAELAGGILAGLVPARNAVSMRMVLGTVEQAAVSLGIGTVKTALLRNDGISGAAAALLRDALTMAGAAAGDARGWAGWSGSVASAGVRLASEVGSDAAVRVRQAVRVASL
jgi:geranylgeranyl reductase family protein